MKKKQKKQLSYVAAKRKCDRIFSEYIRLRDCTEGQSKIGHCKSTLGGFCISCGKFKPYTELQCGHFVNRKWMSLRYDEKNCNAQCIQCNCFDEGNNIGYHQGLVRKYGKYILDYFAVAKKQIKLSVFDLQVIAEKYKNKIKELK